MSIPDFQTVMLPVLQIVADGRDHHIRDLTNRIADQFHLTEEERNRLLPSGHQRIISNRVAWAKSYLKMAGLLENPSRGYIRISPAGRELLRSNPTRIDIKLLKTFPSYLDFVKKSDPSIHSNGSDAGNSTLPEQSKTPREQIDEAYRALRIALAEDLLEKVRASTPRFFEEIVVRLLVAMGYGGSLADAGERIGKAGDGGIDGIIKEDRLGLDVVCIQAKRWEGTVGRPVVQSFVGSMEMHRARKGVLITTSTFSEDALNYIKMVESKKIVLINGETLAELMIDYNVGIAVAETYLVKKIDHDFFNEDGD